MPSKWYIDHQQGLEFKPQNVSPQRQNLSHTNSPNSTSASPANSQSAQTPPVQPQTGAAVANNSEATTPPRFAKANRPVPAAAPESPGQPPQEKDAISMGALGFSYYANFDNQVVDDDLVPP